MVRSISLTWTIALYLCFKSSVIAQIDEWSYRERISRPRVYAGSSPYQGADFTDQSISSALRSQRDLAMNISINRIESPAINLASSFFGNNYTDAKVQDIGSVLNMGYRRLVLDLYWDSSRGNWQLCPEAIPSADLQQHAAQRPDIVLPIASINESATVQPVASYKKQSVNQSSISAMPRSQSSLLPSIRKGVVANRFEPLQSDVTLGTQTCTPWITFRHFMNYINLYLNGVDPLRNRANTDLFYLILNLNNINVNSSTGSQPINTDPQWTNNLSTNQSLSLRQTISSSMGQSLLKTPRVYTPQNLTADRSNLSASFNTTGLPYFTTAKNSTSSKLTTDNGWPPWYYLIEKQVQLLVGFGDNLLPSDSNYNVEDDASYIFDQQALSGGSMMNVLNVSSMAATGWTNCSTPGNNIYMVPSGNETTELDEVPAGGRAMSWSWAYMTDQGSPFNYYSGYNASSCGYSLYMTSTYSSSEYPEAPNDSTTLADPILSTIWSWDVGQPPYVVADSSNGSSLMCASVQVSNGRWVACDCAQLFRVACQNQNDPNVWLLTNGYYSYDRAAAACPEQYLFDAPRNAQQNHMLFLTMKSAGKRTASTASVQNQADNQIWIDLNNGGGQDCWVVGKNTTCWWTNAVRLRYFVHVVGYFELLY
ncbi:hypothetical protein NQZ79_g6342 [Umbelopsis isabellina]|nr:hypothetical protein NQZ79_g6342 [Umbelopsis isabellina]